MHVPAVLLGHERLGDEPVLDQLGGPPLARQQHVVTEVPEEVVGQVLRAAIQLPPPLHGEAVVVEDEDAARALALLVAQRAQIDPLGAAVHGMHAGVAGLCQDLPGLDGLHEARRSGIGLGVEDVNPGGPKPGNDQVSPLDVGMRRVGTERRAARVPAEVVQLVADVGHLHPAYDLPAAARRRVHVHHHEGVGPGPAGVDGHDVRQLFCGGLGGKARRGVERGIGKHGLGAGDHGDLLGLSGLYTSPAQRMPGDRPSGRPARQRRP